MNDIMRWRKSVLNKTDEIVQRFSGRKAPHRILHLQQLAGVTPVEFQGNGHVNNHRSGENMRKSIKGQTQSAPVSTERYVSLGTAQTQSSIPPQVLHHGSGDQSEKIALTPEKSTPKTWEYFRPADVIAKSDLTVEEKMAALAAFCDPKEATGSQKRRYTPPVRHEAVEPPKMMEVHHQMPSASSEDSYTGVDIERWMEESFFTPEDQHSFDDESSHHPLDMDETRYGIG